MREYFRAWAEALESFFLEVVILEERHDFRAKLTRAILFGGSKVFQAIIKLRRWLYDFRIFRDKTLGVQVIAIGNLTLGGTGKTPGPPRRRPQRGHPLPRLPVQARAFSPESPEQSPPAR